jgi:DNA-binding MarR family transcriptional regulator
VQALPDFGLDPERAALADELFAVNLRVHDRAMSLVGPMPTPPDLTMQQVRVLGHVAAQPGIAGHELGRLLGVSAPTASGLIERLVEKDLITRVDDADDRRVRRLHPTEAGLDVMRDMDSMFGRALGVVLQRLSVEDLDLLLRSARAMLAALERLQAEES